LAELANNDANQYAGDEADLEDEQRDGEQRGIFEATCAVPNLSGTHERK
jgi:hypothetical protein